MPIPIVTHKVCTSCAESKPIDDFYFHRRKNRNPYRVSVCKACHHQMTQAWRSKHVDAARTSNRNYAERNADKIAAKSRRQRELIPEIVAGWKERYRQNNPQKIRAKNIVSAAKASGKLVPGNCADCGNLKTEAHHEDYSKPLEVIWLCHRCHMKRHRKHADVRPLFQ